jgi:hypothetical protein
VKQKFVYQDMLRQRSKICDEARAVEKPKIEKRLKFTTMQPQLRFRDERQNTTTATNACDCKSKDANIRLKCNCPESVETSKTQADSVNQSPIVSNEVEGESFSLSMEAV